MDFFYGLDNGRYAAFKATIINGITAGSIDQPENLNEKPKIVEPEKPKRDLSKVKCFACGQCGHYANKCPDKGGGSDDIEHEIKCTFATWDDASM
jgi:hypothetical protein